MDVKTAHRANVELRKAVSNIQHRFLERVGDRVARGISMRELCEELIIEALEISNARYGCVVSLDDEDQAARQYDTLLTRTADAAIDEVFKSGKPTFSNQASLALPYCLPSCHPPIDSFAVLPIAEGDVVQAALFVANTGEQFDLVILNRLTSMLNAFASVSIKSIVNKGINNVITDVQRASRQLIALMNASVDSIMTIDEQGQLTAFNPAAEELFELPSKRALGMDIRKCFPVSIVSAILKQTREYKLSLSLREGRPYRYDGTVALKGNGEEVPINLVVYHSRHNEHVYTTLIVDDMSGRMESARELQGTLTQYQTLTRLAPVGILQLGSDWTCEFANDTFCELTGLELQASLKNGWIDALHPDDVVQTLMDLRDALAQGHVFRRDLRLRPSDNKASWVCMNATGMHDREGGLVGSLVVFMDITEQQAAETRLVSLAHSDALTGLQNRLFFLSTLDSYLNDSTGSDNCALLYIDLDGFKAVNDTLGHDFGDKLLKLAAGRIQEVVRTDDIVARLGGDEFVVMLRNVRDKNDVARIADAIVQKTKQSFPIHDEEVYVSASVGIALGSQGLIDRSTLIKQADTALYRAKESGRARYIFYSKELEEARRHRSSLINSLRRAVERNAFELYYQPQIDMNKQQLLGFEALLRWPQESGDYVNPQEFIDVLEESGLISDVGRWAIDQACCQYMSWKHDSLVDERTTISVNVSARQLGTANFAKSVKNILQRYRMPGKSLVLEITESALVEHIDSNVLKEIKQLDVQISLDDFGTGYSSLAYLSDLPLDHLKIDRSFISAMPRHAHGKTIVKSIIALARTLGIKVIAEGVENAAVIPLLKEEGCAGYQGFYLSPPLPATDVADLVIRLEAQGAGRYINFIDLS